MKQYEPLDWELDADAFRYSGDFFAHIPADQDLSEFAQIPVELRGHVTREEGAEDMSAFIPGTKTDLWDLLTERAQRLLRQCYERWVSRREREAWESAQESAWEARAER